MHEHAAHMHLSCVQTKESVAYPLPLHSLLRLVLMQSEIKNFKLLGHTNLITCSKDVIDPNFGRLKILE